MNASRARIFAAALAAVLLATFSFAPSAFSQDARDADVLSRDAVLRDPDIPAAGNPNGDITIVEFFDFQCPYCKQANADLATLLKEDGNLRLVFKDWPILGEISTTASRMVLAAKYQGKFVEAHNALMQHRGRLTEASLTTALSSAGIDTKKAAADLKANGKAIDAILARNNAQAEAFGFNGTPSFIVGTFRVPGVLSIESFRQAIKDARELRQKSGDK